MSPLSTLVFSLSGAHIFACRVRGIAGSQGTHIFNLIDKARRFPTVAYQLHPALLPSSV